MEVMREQYGFTPRLIFLLILSENILIVYSLRAYRDRFAQWEFTKRQVSLHKDNQLVARVKELWGQNMTSANILRCLSVHRWNLSAIQLRNLRLHPSLRLLMGTANGAEANFEAAVRAEDLVRTHMISGQAI